MKAAGRPVPPSLPAWATLDQILGGAVRDMGTTEPETQERPEALARAGRLLGASLPLFKLAGIRVRLHWSFALAGVILAAWTAAGESGNLASAATRNASILWHLRPGRSQLFLPLGRCSASRGLHGAHHPLGAAGRPGSYSGQALRYSSTRERGGRGAIKPDGFLGHGGQPYGPPWAG